MYSHFAIDGPNGVVFAVVRRDSVIITIHIIITMNIVNIVVVSLVITLVND